jgi:hypothetical protein
MEDFLVDQEKVQIMEQTTRNSRVVITIGIWNYKFDWVYGSANYILVYNLWYNYYNI